MNLKTITKGRSNFFVVNEIKMLEWISLKGDIQKLNLKIKKMSYIPMQNL